MAASFGTFLTTIGLKCNNCNQGYNDVHNPVIIDSCKSRVCANCINIYRDAILNRQEAPCPGCKNDHTNHVKYCKDEAVSEQVQKAKGLWDSMQANAVSSQPTPPPALRVVAIPCGAGLNSDCAALASYETGFNNLVGVMKWTGNSNLDQLKTKSPKSFWILTDSATGAFLGFTVPVSLENASKWELEYFSIIKLDDFDSFLEAVLIRLKEEHLVHDVSHEVTVPITNAMARSCLNFALNHGMEYTVTNSCSPFIGRTVFKFKPYKVENALLTLSSESDTVKIITHEQFTKVRKDMDKLMADSGIARLINMYKQGEECEAIKRQFRGAPDSFIKLDVNGKTCGFGCVQYVSPVHFEIGHLFFEPAYNGHADVFCASFLRAAVSHMEEKSESWVVSFIVDSVDKEVLRTLLQRIAEEKNYKVGTTFTDSKKTLLIYN